MTLKVQIGTINIVHNSRDGGNDYFTDNWDWSSQVGPCILFLFFQQHGCSN